MRKRKSRTNVAELTERREEKEPQLKESPTSLSRRRRRTTTPRSTQDTGPLSKSTQRTGLPSTSTGATRKRRRKTESHAPSDHPKPDPDWRFLYTLSQEKEFIPNLEKALRERTSLAEKATYPSGVPVYRVPVSEMDKFDEWPHVVPGPGMPQTLERRYLRLKQDIYQRAVVFNLWHIMEYLVKRGTPWAKLGGVASRRRKR